MLAQWNTFVLEPDQLRGPLLAILLQATFFVTERLHERQRSAPDAKIRPARPAAGRQFLYWLRRLGLAIGLLRIGHLDNLSPLWLMPGVALFAAGMGVRWFAVSTLGQFFTRQLMIQRDHVLRKDGLYRYVRHPAYSGMLLCNCAIGWLTFNWISFVVITGTTMVLLRQRIMIEEALLIAAFGQEYEGYRRDTQSIVPWIY
jgi:protein-S-isoprenylcysteine O-methyltransferase Ste14